MTASSPRAGRCRASEEAIAVVRAMAGRWPDGAEPQRLPHRGLDIGGTEGLHEA